MADGVDRMIGAFLRIAPKVPTAGNFWKSRVQQKRFVFLVGDGVFGDLEGLD